MLVSSMQMKQDIWESPQGSRHPQLLSIPTCHKAKLLQSCPTLCDPIDGSPPGSLIPGILQARILEWVVISFSKISCYLEPIDNSLH